jgi:hypothetical protein
MRKPYRAPSVVWAALLLAGCGSGGSAGPAGQPDAGEPVPDAAVMSPDAAADTRVAPPADSAGDVPAMAPDAAPDAPLADASSLPDLAPDLAPAVDSAPAGTCGTGALTTPAIKGPAAGMTDADQTFRSLAIDPTNADVVYVGSEGNGIFRTMDGGAHWTWLRAGLRHDGHPAYAEAWDLAIAASKPKRIFAAMTDSPGPVSGQAPSARGGVYRSDDGGDSWRQIGCALPNAKTASVWVDPANADLVIAGLEGGAPSFMPPPPLAYYPGGLWKSSDGGETWTELALPAGHERNSYWRIARRGGKLWTFALDGREMPDKGLGFLSSADGSTFTAAATSFAGKLVTGWDVSSDGMTILASVRDSFRLQRSIDGGATFQFVTAIDQARANGPVAISADGKVVLFASNEQLHRSEDGLATSAPVLAAPAFIEEVEWATSHPEVVYATVRGLRLYRSADAGKTWAPAGSLRADVIDKN